MQSAVTVVKPISYIFDSNVPGKIRKLRKHSLQHLLLLRQHEKMI